MEKAYRLKDAAELLGMKMRTLRQWIADGKISAFKYPDSNLWFIKESEIKKKQKMAIKNK